jgi:Holliday junction resolvase RusA-like endonuclease
MLFEGRLALPPRPASRPRFTCRGRFAVAYTDKPYREWLDAAAQELSQLQLPKGWDTSQPMAMSVSFKVQRPKTSKLAYPKPDLDNYEKALLDAITQAGGIWDDDSQVVVLSSEKLFAADDGETGIDFSIRGTTLP